MAISTRVSHPCSRCQQPVDVELHTSFVIDSDAALRFICDNRFHLVHCARCGELRTFERDFLVTNKARDMFVQVIEHDKDVASMRESMRSMLGPNVYARIVPSRNDLVEKVRLWSQGLDDVAVEVLKFFNRLQWKDVEGKTKRFFLRVDGDQMLFTVIAPGKPSEVNAMAMEIYRNVIRDMKTASYARELEVDERLARRLLDEERNAKQAKAAPQAPAAQTPAFQAPAPQTPAPQTKAAPQAPAPQAPAPQAPASSPHRYLELPIVPEHFGPTDGARVTLTSKAVSLVVDVATGAFTSQSGRYARQTLAAPFSAIGDLKIEAVETAEGPRAIVRSPQGAHAELTGAPIDLVRTGNLVVAVIDDPSRGPTCEAFVLGAPARVRLPVTWRAPLAAGDGVVACAGPGFVHVIRAEGSSVSAITVPIPGAYPPDVSLATGRLCAVAGQHLAILDLAAIPRGAGHRVVGIDLVGIRGPGERAPEPARVVSAMTSKIVVDHPRLGRLTLAASPGGPTVTRGAEVMIEDVREELPGVRRVYAWRAGSAAPCVAPFPPPISLPAPDLAKVAPSAPSTPARPSSRIAEKVAAIANRHGFVAPPLLLRLLEARARDPVLARWLGLLGLELEGPGTMIEDWETDPSLLELSQLGNGDAHCLYIYPPYCRDGQEPPVVMFSHETKLVDFMALSFADFLEIHLSAKGHDPRIVGFVRERLGMPPRTVTPATPPAWLPLDGLRSTAAPTIDQALALERGGDVLGAERALLRGYLGERTERGRARAELQRIYAALGWSFALENLGKEAADV